jgi:hypothetical protein
MPPGIAAVAAGHHNDEDPTVRRRQCTIGWQQAAQQQLTCHGYHGLPYHSNCTCKDGCGGAAGGPLPPGCSAIPGLHGWMQQFTAVFGRKEFFQSGFVGTGQAPEVYLRDRVPADNTNTCRGCTVGDVCALGMSHGCWLTRSASQAVVAHADCAQLSQPQVHNLQCHLSAMAVLYNAGCPQNPLLHATSPGFRRHYDVRMMRCTLLRLADAHSS